MASDRVSTQSRPNPTPKQRERILAQMRPEARMVCEEILQEAAIYDRNSLSYFYKLGEHIRTIVNDPKYTEDDLRNVSLVTGYEDTTFRRALMFCSRVTRDELFSRLLGNSASGSKVVTWSHIIELLQEEDEAQFWKLIDRVGREGMSVRALREVMDQKRQQGNRARGTPAPRTVLGALTQVTSLGKTLKDRLGDDNFFRTINHLKPGAANPQVINGLKQNEEMLQNLSRQAAARAEDMKRARLRLTNVEEAGTAGNAAPVAAPAGTSRPQRPELRPGKTRRPVPASS